MNELGGITYYADTAFDPDKMAKYDNILRREEIAPVSYWWRYFDELKLDGNE